MGRSWVKAAKIFMVCVDSGNGHLMVVCLAKQETMFWAHYPFSDSDQLVKTEVQAILDLSKRTVKLLYETGSDSLELA